MGLIRQFFGRNLLWNPKTIYKVAINRRTIYYKTLKLGKTNFKVLRIVNSNFYAPDHFFKVIKWFENIKKEEIQSLNIFLF